MRGFCVAVLGLVALAGCSITADAVPDAKGHAKTFVLHVDRDARGRDLVSRQLGLKPIFAATPATKTDEAPPQTLDVATVSNVATTALQIPSLVNELRSDVTVGGTIVFVFGVVVVLFASGSRSRYRAIATATTTDAAGTAGATAHVARSVAIASPSHARRCGCNEEISARSRTGRCRKCARKKRTRGERVVVEMPAILAAAVGDDDDPDTVDAARVVLTESRIGQQRKYYTLESFT